MKTTILLLCLCVFVSMAFAAEDEGLSQMNLVFERGANSAPVISVFRTGGLGDEGDKGVIVCIWSDGRAVWSRDRNGSGSPYLTGYVDPKRLQVCVAALGARGIFAHKVWFSVPVDAPEDHAYVLYGRKRVALDCVAGMYSAADTKTPKRITSVEDAFAALHQQVEALLPTENQKLRSFKYELRPIP